MGSPTGLRIQEQSPHEDGFHATISFDSGPHYSITLRNPFNDEQEDELEWYFEQHLRFPFTQTVRAKNAAAPASRELSTLVNYQAAHCHFTSLWDTRCELSHHLASSRRGPPSE